MTAQREFDLVLVGATGFVGRLTARHLAEHTPASVRIALAGRSTARLEAVRAELPTAAAEWPLLELDSTDERAVATLAERTRVVVTTVGPYARLGMPLASACARAGTHYADLTGEVLFVRNSIDANETAAQASGAKIVHACGFDSIPSDLGVWLTAQQVAADGKGTLGDTVLHVRTLRGGVSGGTIDSMRGQALAMSDASSRKTVADPYGLSPDRAGEPPSRSRGDATSGLLSTVKSAAARTGIRHDHVTGRWNAPFVMGPFNAQIVRRSNALSDWSYGRNFRYSEVMDTGTGPLGAFKSGLTTAALGALVVGMSTPPTRAVLDRVLPRPGEGPSEQRMARGRFAVEVQSTTTTGAGYQTTVTAPYDPGYAGTAVMLGESGLALALDELPDRAGVLTPAVAFEAAIVDRLRAHDFTFETARAVS